MPAVPVSPLVLPAIAPHRYARNGLIVPPQAQNAVVAGMNQLLRWRTREVFPLGLGRVQSIAGSSGAGPTVIARAYGRTGAYCAALRWSLLLAKPTDSTIADPYIELDIRAAGGASFGIGEAHYGAINSGASDTPDEWQEHTGILPVDSSAAVEAIVSARNNGRLVTGCVWEESLEPLTDNGYFQAVTNLQAIFDEDRRDVADALKSLCDDNGGTQICLTDCERLAFASATDTNIFDGTSTIVSAATPGFTLDMRYKARRHPLVAGVPIVVQVYGSCAAGANGRVRVKDSTGATLLTVGPFSTTPGWVSGTFRAPATLAKYDLMISTAASTVSVNYVSLYEYGP